MVSDPGQNKYALVAYRMKIIQAIMSKYGVLGHELRCYVHYQPSYYHFHLHITHLQLDEGHGMAAGKAHLLEDVIDNLEVR
jgi:m7GpppX diphosphatase